MIWRHSSIWLGSVRKTVCRMIDWRVASRPEHVIETSAKHSRLFAESAATLRDRCGHDMTDVIQLDGRKTNPRAGCLAHGVRGHSEFLHVSTTANGRKTDDRRQSLLGWDRGVAAGSPVLQRLVQQHHGCGARADPTYEILSIGGGRRSLPESARHERFQIGGFFQESARPGIELESKGQRDLVESVGLYQ